MRSIIKNIDKFLANIPKGKSIVYYSTPGVEGEIFGMQTVYSTLKKGGTCVFVVASTMPNIIKDKFKEFGWDMNLFKDKLFFLDSYNPLIGAHTDEKYVVSNPDNIESFNKTITDIIKELPPSTIVFGSLSTIMDLCGEKETIEAVWTWNKMAMLYDHKMIYNFITWPYSQKTLNLIKNEIFNSVIFIGGMSDRELFVQYFRILKCDWTKETDKNIVPFRILRPGGINVLNTKILTTSPYDSEKATFLLVLDHGFEEKKSILLQTDTTMQEPEIIFNHIANTEKEWVRFCLVQLDFTVEPGQQNEDFRYVILEKEKTKEKIFKTLKIAMKNKVDVICFPELSFAKEWVDEIKNQYKDMIIIAGSFYDGEYNVCTIIIGGEYITLYKKYHPSAFENPAPTGRGMKSGNRIYIFQTKYGRFSVLTCIDYTDQSHPICRYKGKGFFGVDYIINPCYDQNIKRFQHRCNSDCEDYGISVLQMNRAPIEGKYGRTCIIGKEHEIILKRLKDENFKPQDDIKYKLIEASGEMIIIADLNIITKAPPIDLPINYAGRIRIIKRYKYENENWQPLSNLTLLD